MAERDIKSEKEKVKQLLAKGKEKGTLSYEEIMDSLSSTELSPEQINDVYEQINAMGIKLVDVYKRQAHYLPCFGEKSCLSLPQYAGDGRCFAGFAALFGGTGVFSERGGVDCQ